MRHSERLITLGQAIGMSVALTAALAAPIAPAAAAPAGVPVSSASGVSAVRVEPAAEVPSVDAFRTTGILAGVAIGVVTLVGLWWYLLIRSRRD